MTISEAAHKVLGDLGEPLHLGDLLTQIRKRDLYQFEGEDALHSLGKALGSRCKSGSAGEVLFYRAAKATYGLVEWEEPVVPEDISDKLIPAQELYKYICSIFPMTKNSWISSIDDALIENSDLEGTLYNSTIFYLCRRLVQRAKLVTRDVGSTSGVLDESEALVLIRNDCSKFNFVGADHEHLSWLLRECISEAKRAISSGTVKRLLREGEDNDVCCYICGRKLDYENKGTMESAEVEHIWPKSMGGSNAINNLAISCHKCNQYKGDLLGSEDFHYEHLCLLEKNDTFKYEHRISVLLKHGCECSLCGKKVTESGGLSIEKKNQDDVWHYTNMHSICSDHMEIINE